MERSQMFEGITIDIAGTPLEAMFNELDKISERKKHILSNTPVEKMNQDQLDDIKERLKKLPEVELEYFKNWMLNNSYLMALNKNIDIDTLVFTLNLANVSYEEIDNLLNSIASREEWEINESDVQDSVNKKDKLNMEEQNLIESLKMTQEQLDNTEERLNNLSVIEYRYFRFWVVQQNPSSPDLIKIVSEEVFRGEEPDTNSFVNVINGYIKYEEIDKFLIDIKDQSTWEFPESFFGG